MNTINITCPGIQKKVLERAINMLAALKVDYAIRMADGTVLGNLPIAPEKKTTRTVSNNWTAEFPGYIEQLKGMKLGDVLSWTVDSPKRAAAFRASISGNMSHHFGHKSAMTEVRGCTIEVMRVG